MLKIIDQLAFPILKRSKGNYKKRFSLFALLSIFPCFFSKETLAKFQITQLETETIPTFFNTLAAASIFRTVEPASDLGKLFGFYIGIEGSEISLKPLYSIFSNSIPLGYFPIGDLQFGATGPFGITAEFGLLPESNLRELSFGRTSGSLKWTPTRSILTYLPFDFAGRVSLTNTHIGIAESFSGLDFDVRYLSTLWSAGIVLSKSFLLFEPFVSLGVVRYQSKLSASAGGKLFGYSFPTGSESIPESGFSPWYQSGILIKLLVIGIAAQYDYAFGMGTYTAKVSLRF